MNCVERTLSFECGGESLLGIVSTPLEEKAQADIGVVIIVGGPQYRVGSHRQFVLLARALAAGGYPVLRFDYRGMGDSIGELHTFENVDEDIAAATDALLASTGVKRVVLWGLCDGASAALLYWHATRDARISGLCLLNPWVRSDISLARAHLKHYYTDRLKQKDFWIKLFSGKVAVEALAGLWRNLTLTLHQGNVRSAGRRQPFQQRMAVAWTEFGGGILLLLSGNDYTAKEFLEYESIDPRWKLILERPNVVRHDIAEADHTFADIAMRIQIDNLMLDWLKDI